MDKKVKVVEIIEGEREDEKKKTLEEKFAKHLVDNPATIDKGMQVIMRTPLLKDMAKIAEEHFKT